MSYDPPIKSFDPIGYFVNRVCDWIEDFFKSSICCKPEHMPEYCPVCASDDITMYCIDYDAEVKHGGKIICFNVVDLHIPICNHCGEKIFTLDVDEQINKSLHAYLEKI